MRRWAKVVARVLAVVVAVPLLFAVVMYANAWHQRGRAERLLAVIKTMTPGVTTEAEYMNAERPLHGLEYWGGNPGDLSISNFPNWNWLNKVCEGDSTALVCRFMIWIMPVGTMFRVIPLFADGKLKYLGLWEGQSPLRYRCCALVMFYARGYENSASELPDNFDGYSVSPWEGSMWLTTVKLDERATPAERDSALDFSFKCFTTYRTCRDGAQFLRPAPNRPGSDGSR